jgi:single-strand DNA-binding protein
MAGNLNKVQLLGNVGKDPEIRTTQDGKEIANIVLATSDSWRDKNTGEKREKTEWHRIVIFSDGLINVIKNYVKKGTKLYIEGALQTRKWVDSNNQEKYTTEIVLQGFNSTLLLLDSRAAATSNQSFTGMPEKIVSKTETNALAEELDDEIPF